MTARVLAVRVPQLALERPAMQLRAIERLYADLAIDPGHVRRQCTQITGSADFALVLFDEFGFHRWFPVQPPHGELIPFVDVAGAKKLRLAFLCPEGVS